MTPSELREIIIAATGLNRSLAEVSFNPAAEAALRNALRDVAERALTYLSREESDYVV